LLIQFLKVIAVIAALSLTIPLWIWGTTGSLRHGLHAWKQWAKIMSFIALVGGGLGILASLLA
jgi:hypothetical protein